MSVKNYDLSYFASKHEELNRKYLHYVVLKHNLDQWKSLDAPKPVAPIISNLSLTVKRGELIGVKGSVGSGKSSLFCCILGEMKPTDVQLDSTEGKPLHFDYEEAEQTIDPMHEPFIKISGRIAYCPQNSPIFSSTIRENITFYKPFDEQRYNRIVDICCLLPDFDIFTAGDKTEVGGRGVTLSGGQRARIALARALYNDADIYFLDDPLSAVDAHVGKRIWNEAIMGYLIAQGKTVIIASHQVHYFKTCDRVITIEGGVIIEDLANEKLLKSADYIYPN